MISLIGIILSFSIPKYNEIIEESNISEAKSNILMIQNSISQQISKNILLSNTLSLSKLDDAIVNKNDESLFTNILNFNIKSTSSILNKPGKWIKTAENSYTFIISKDLSVKYFFEDNSFICKSSQEICSKVE